MGTVDKPVVLVDMDGPLADFDGTFFMVAAANGFEFDIADLTEQKHRFLTDHMPNKDEARTMRYFCDSPGWFLNLEVTPGAIEGLNALTEFAEVWICTKPLEVNPACRDEKAEWLRRHFGCDWDHRLIIAPDKSLVRGAVLLDDAPKLEWLGRAEWAPRVFPAPFNGVGSPWGHLPRWTWGDPIESLFPYIMQRWIGRAA